MKKKIKNYGGVLGFYVLILISAFLINARFDYLNTKEETNNINVGEITYNVN